LLTNTGVNIELYFFEVIVALDGEEDG